MKRGYKVSLATKGGVQDLSRVVNVLALLDLTPTAMAVTRRAGGLQIDLCIEGEERAFNLCLAHLQALVAAKGAVSAVPLSSPSVGS